MEFVRRTHRYLNNSEGKSHFGLFKSSFLKKNGPNKLTDGHNCLLAEYLFEDYYLAGRLLLFIMSDERSDGSLKPWLAEFRETLLEREVVQLERN